MAGFKLTTKKGYDFFEVASAFQKAIRRCDEKSAMYWAVELYESGKAAYAWKRMLIMASEDVGMGDQYIAMAIKNLKDTYDFLLSLKERGKPERLQFTHAVLMLVHCKKSRYVDLAISVYWKMNEAEVMQIPDYVYDMHTRRGKAMGRGLEHFYSEAALINNAKKMPNEVAMEELALRADQHFSRPVGVENISCSQKEAVQLSQGDIFDDNNKTNGTD